MGQVEATELTRLRHTQSSLWQFIAAGLDIDGSHRQAMAEVDQAITCLVARRWRGMEAGAIRMAGRDCGQRVLSRAA
ncbi:hypothetical protein [Zavarzinia sp. CC-PAN008]|uniref:hypothetical protein n=1 Tax=Zavarzinia sp. CC-PAN008 TaxID=3243332 RepID=UPI003F747917